MICDPSTRRLGAMIKRRYEKRLPINYPEEQQQPLPLCSLPSHNHLKFPLSPLPPPPPPSTARKKAIIVETKIRLARIPAYVEKKKWYEVKNELTRYMYETRGACKYLATTVQQKEAATDFFQAIEKITLNTTLKNQEGAFAAQKEAIEKLDKFSAMI